MKTKMKTGAKYTVKIVQKANIAKPPTRYGGNAQNALERIIVAIMKAGCALIILTLFLAVTIKSIATLRPRLFMQC